MPRKKKQYTRRYDKKEEHVPTYWERFWNTARSVAPYAGALGAAVHAGTQLYQSANPDWWQDLWTETYVPRHRTYQTIPDLEDVSGPDPWHWLPFNERVSLEFSSDYNPAHDRWRH